MTQEFSKGSDNYNNQSPKAENLTSQILYDQVISDSKAANPASRGHRTDLPPASVGFSDTSGGSPVTNNSFGASTGSGAPVEVNTGAASTTTNEQLNFKDDSLFCGESSSEDAAWYLNWNMVPEAVQTIDLCQSMASNPNSFSNFMENVVKRDSFWGAEIDLQYSTDKKLGTQVSGFMIRQ